MYADWHVHVCEYIAFTFFIQNNDHKVNFINCMLIVIDYRLCGQEGCLKWVICMLVRICVHGPVHLSCIVSCSVTM